jgi:hypothetical protein
VSPNLAVEEPISSRINVTALMRAVVATIAARAAPWAAIALARKNGVRNGTSRTALAFAKLLIACVRARTKSCRIFASAVRM